MSSTVRLTLGLKRRRHQSFSKQQQECTTSAVLRHRYEVLSALGSGAFSSIVLARDFLFEGQLVAVKCMTPGYHMLGQNEILALKAIKSDFVVEIQDSFIFDDRFYLVMDKLEARPLALPHCDHDHSSIRCPQRHLSLAKHAMQILTGVHAIHAAGLTHADIKPCNILYIPSTSRIKIIDLGNAVSESQRSAYYSDFELQSAHYRAPEVLLGFAPFNEKIDIFSVGVILVELLLGTAPLLDAPLRTRTQLIERHVELLGDISCYESGLFYRKLFGTPAGMLQYKLQPCSSTALVEFLLALTTVDCSKRPTAYESLRHPFLLYALLGEWGEVIAPTAVVKQEPDPASQVENKTTPTSCATAGNQNTRYSVNGEAIVYATPDGKQGLLSPSSEAIAFERSHRRRSCRTPFTERKAERRNIDHEVSTDISGGQTTNKTSECYFNTFKTRKAGSSLDSSPQHLVNSRSTPRARRKVKTPSQPYRTPITIKNKHTPKRSISTPIGWNRGRGVAPIDDEDDIDEIVLV